MTRKEKMNNRKMEKKNDIWKLQMKKTRIEKKNDRNRKNE